MFIQNFVTWSTALKTEFLKDCYENIKHSQIVCQENGRKYVALNKGCKNVLKIHVDGDLIRSGKRCDYALGLLDEKKVYLIELKGCDISHACEQILKSLDFFKKNEGWNQADYYARIVVSKFSSPKLPSVAQKRLIFAERRKIIVNYRISEKYLQETI